MAHVIEPAASGRAKCRGCTERIAAGELRFGEHLPNPFAEGDMTHWFHAECAAYKRPESFLETLETTTVTLADSERLESDAKSGVAHPRLPRINGAERASSGRAACRSCEAAVEKGAWRIALVYYEEGRFLPSGFIHVRCAPAYFETADIIGRVKRFAPQLSEEDLREIETELQGTAS